ncbi:MAG: glutamine synthetase III [Lachnospiraceae bacterium]|nr:glutamine synthetase III [Lachnospiraceae bacterium]
MAETEKYTEIREETATRIDEIFGQNVFNDNVMRQRLPKKTYRELRHVIDEGRTLDPVTADVIAHAMKEWAIEKGATHFTHWFQPLTGITAEKHDAFISHEDEEGRVMTEFSGKELVKGEADASSFPSGGTRSTFEARGYTTWDCSSPAFIKESGCGKILCIPTAFNSYTGEALDKKTPLLRSMDALSEQALRIVRLFGDDRSKRVNTSVGPEQEYFLIDEKLYRQRPDLMYSGRTLFGAPAPRGQEMEDHYYGVIRERVGEFMKDLNTELWKLGVTAKTQHNEVAPAQHELAPIYETANIAVDHNQLVMETMKRVAVHHGMRCLLHEKPYAGVNGSGKHNNWSLSTDRGKNLLDPGDTPNQNVQFLLVLSCIIKAVDVHADLLRQSAADVGNDHRLGANEAPPAIMSVFLGEQLQDVVDQLITTGEATSVKQGEMLRTGASTVPDVEMDATDRNRTSPFAFTGNKFEFRSVGSADSIAAANTVLNAIVAEAFCDAANELEKASDFQMAVHDLIKKNLTEHQRIIFNGNGYSRSWVKEAGRRGLANIPSMIEAAPALTSDRSVELFEKFGIFTKKELTSREEVVYETYSKTIHVEAVTMVEMASKQILPACIRYAGELAKSVREISGAGIDADVEKKMLKDVTDRIEIAKRALDKLSNDVDKSAGIRDEHEKAFFYKDVIMPDMSALRKPVDELELMVDRTMWPFPAYGELMFEV